MAVHTMHSLRILSLLPLLLYSILTTALPATLPPKRMPRTSLSYPRLSLPPSSFNLSPPPPLHLNTEASHYHYHHHRDRQLHPLNEQTDSTCLDTSSSIINISIIVISFGGDMRRMDIYRLTIQSSQTRSSIRNAQSLYSGLEIAVVMMGASSLVLGVGSPR